MSELREAAQAALTAYETFRDVDDIDGLDDAIDHLRAALAKPEVEPPRDEWREAVRDEWRPASEPPDTTRSVLIWLRFGDVETFGKTLGGPSGFAFQNGAITHWRDVTPPTEAQT